MTTPNVPFILAALAALGAVSLHVYTMEVWIWPKLRVEGFAATPFGSAYVTKAFYRIVWHFFTVSWVLTIFLLLRYAFSETLLYANLIVLLMILYWLGIVISIFITAALSLRPGDSYIRTMIKAFQWVLVLVMVGLMYWGTTL